MKYKTKKQLREENWDLINAIRLTQEYSQLPAVEGWSWYDALKKYAPALLTKDLGIEKELG